MGLSLMTSAFLCRQEVMDLVTKSGQFSKKFEGFTGRPFRPSLIFQTKPICFPLILIGTCNLLSDILNLDSVICLVSAGTSDPLGKRLNNSKTREEIGWEPKYPSFSHFLGVSE